MVSTRVETIALSLLSVNSGKENRKEKEGGDVEDLISSLEIDR